MSTFFGGLSAWCHSNNAVRASQMLWSNVEVVCKRSNSRQCPKPWEAFLLRLRSKPSVQVDKDEMDKGTEVRT